MYVASIYIYVIAHEVVSREDCKFTFQQCCRSHPIWLQRNISFYSNFM